MSGFCSICGFPNCERMSHVSVQDFPYEGTLQELQSVDMELVDIHNRRAELNRLEELLQEHRREVLRRMDLSGTPVSAR